MKCKAACSKILSLCLLLSHTGYSQTPQYTDFEPSVFEGSTAIEQVYSPTLEGNLQGNPSTQPVKVYLPPGYDDYPLNKYPVIYLLHGYTEDYNSFYHKYGLQEYLDQMIGEKSIVPMIIVTPNAKTAYDGSYYTNSYVSGNWRDYVVQDVMQFVENSFRTLNQRESRGLSGFSMGAYGTIKIGMKCPSLYSSLALLSGSSVLDFKEHIINGPARNTLITAAQQNEYRSSDPWGFRALFALAVAFAPDSSFKPILGRLPYSADSVLIDSILQKWLTHEPATMLSEYKDSLRKINAIQIYVGTDDDSYPFAESFHQSLLDEGIDHGYEVHQGDHDPEPVFGDMLKFFSEKLVGAVPNVRTSSDYFLENIDKLFAESSMDGKLYIVPLSTYPDIDSIHKYQVATVEVLANVENEFQLSEFEYGRYLVIAESSDGAVSNIPGEFSVVPHKLPPDLRLVNATVDQGDSIHLSISRDGKIFLHTPPFLIHDTLRTASEIMNSPKLIESADALANTEVSFSTDDLAIGEYWIYGFDQYGIVAGPISVVVGEATGNLALYLPKIELFPNPVSEIVSFQTNIHDQYEITMTGLDGQQMYSRIFEGTSFQIDLSSLEKGVYIITIRSEDFITTRKIIKL